MQVTCNLSASEAEVKIEIVYACHPERSEGSRKVSKEILHSVQTFGWPL